ncbi:hypothetical protein QBC36DRAFT_354409 [Triangularia setosa]|uniref:Uncharacterized protein n=1 Tax=Triangularia setosa TaxID=2587417 RepID=A0AAN6W512_9PEZI|nr:hypothetical protein QBC36DRAFT_354409 [Podospora setosa]
MTTVCTNAFLVIAASKIKDVDDGCSPDSRAASKEGVLSMECNRQAGGRSIAYTRLDRIAFNLGRTTMRAGEGAHGWRTDLCQEEQLASRILYYTEDEVQWRCTSYNAYECCGMLKAVGSSLTSKLSGFAREVAAETAVPEPDPQRVYYESPNTLVFYYVSLYRMRDDIHL